MIFSEEQLERYSRHFVLKEIGVSGQKKLLQSEVLVIGAGGLGSGALMYLTAAGVGTVGIADYDRVELSNLHRQMVHRTDRVGMDKSMSAVQTLKQLNPDVSFRTYSKRVTADNIQKIIQPYDFIIDGTDRFESKFLINDACVLSGKPYSHAGAVRFGGQTMTYVPKKGPCLCFLLDEIPPHDENETCSQAGVLGTVTGILGSVQAMEALKYLLGAGTLLVSKILNFYGLSMNLRITEIPRSCPHCKVCGKNPVIRLLTDNRDEYEVHGCTVSQKQRQ